MRLRLLEATVECLVERGFAGTSTTLVSERAGVSRGAQLHHFPTKNDLVVAAVEHLTEIRGAELAAAVAALPSGHRRSYACGAAPARRPLQLAGLRRRARAVGRGAHRRGAATPRSAPLELRVGRETHRLTVEALGADESQPGVRELVQATLDLVRGLGLANTISDDARRRRRILDHWADVLDRELDPPHDVSGLPRSAPPSDTAAGTPT